MRRCCYRRKQPGSSQIVSHRSGREKKIGRGQTTQIQLGFLSLKLIMIVSLRSLPLRCPLPGRWMALVTVQRSPTPSTSSSPCVSVRASFIKPSCAIASTTTVPKGFCCLKWSEASFLLSFCRLLIVTKCLAFVLLRMREMWLLIIFSYTINVSIAAKLTGYEMVVYWYTSGQFSTSICEKRQFYLCLFCAPLLIWFL